MPTIADTITPGFPAELAPFFPVRAEDDVALHATAVARRLIVNTGVDPKELAANPQALADYIRLYSDTFLRMCANASIADQVFVAKVARAFKRHFDLHAPPPSGVLSYLMHDDLLHLIEPLLQSDLPPKPDNCDAALWDRLVHFFPFPLFSCCKALRLRRLALFEDSPQHLLPPAPLVVDPHDAASAVDYIVGDDERPLGSNEDNSAAITPAAVDLGDLQQALSIVMSMGGKLPVLSASDPPKRKEEDTDAIGSVFGFAFRKGLPRPKGRSLPPANEGGAERIAVDRKMPRLLHYSTAASLVLSLAGVRLPLEFPPSAGQVRRAVFAIASLSLVDLLHRLLAFGSRGVHGELSALRGQARWYSAVLVHSDALRRRNSLHDEQVATKQLARLRRSRLGMRDESGSLIRKQNTALLQHRERVDDLQEEVEQASVEFAALRSRAPGPHENHFDFCFGRDALLSNALSRLDKLKAELILEEAAMERKEAAKSSLLLRLELSTPDEDAQVLRQAEVKLTSLATVRIVADGTCKQTEKKMHEAKKAYTSKFGFCSSRRTRKRCREPEEMAGAGTDTDFADESDGFSD